MVQDIICSAKQVTGIQNYFH